jgi:hypothetical protein
MPQPFRSRFRTRSILVGVLGLAAVLLAGEWFARHRLGLGTPPLYFAASATASR